jgi:hypothetical protein
MKNSVLMRSINTLYFRQNNSLILKLTSGQRKRILPCFQGILKKANISKIFQGLQKVTF